MGFELAVFLIPELLEIPHARPLTLSCAHGVLAGGASTRPCSYATRATPGG
jgi:hypothetical protein